MKTENGFREEFSFLSNFTYFEKQMVVRREGYVFSFPTNEHFYQACKFKDYEMIVLVSKHPSKGLKKFINSKKSEWREDWDEIKLLYEALDSRKNTVEKQGLTSKDNMKIAGLKLKFAPM